MTEISLTVETPTKLRISGLDDQRYHLEQCLRYVDKKVQFEVQKNQNNSWLRKKMGYEKFGEYLDLLRKKMNGSLLFSDEKGFWTYTGMAADLSKRFSTPVKNVVVYPKTKPLPWLKPPKHTTRPYQEDIISLLQEIKHGAVEVGTGLGKSLCIVQLVRNYGLKTVVMAPSANIAKQLFEELRTHLGKKYVGFFGDGKKESGKLIVVAIDDSLARVKPGTPAYKDLIKTKVFIADESHICAAATLQTICMGVMGDAPIRHFFSATQMRNDGLDLVLEAITGPIVYSMTVQQGVEQGYLAKPQFIMINTYSSSDFYSKDSNEMTRNHFYYNNSIAKTAADLANNAVTSLGHQVVILVEEVEQFTKLLPYLKHSVRFAHGGVSKDNKDKVPEEYHDSDTTALVDSFNAGEYSILVGTSCISTGTDIRPVQTIINLRARTSEITHKQAVGRGTRLVPGKTEFFFFDFLVENIEKMKEHAAKRLEIYQNIYPDVRTVTYKAL